MSTLTIVDLGPLEPMNWDLAIDLHEACKYLRGRKGRLAYTVAQRFANENRGCRPLKDGPLIILPTIAYAGKRWLMVSWAQAFQRAREELCAKRWTRADPARTPRQTASAHKRAVRDLAKDGFKSADGES